MALRPLIQGEPEWVCVVADRGVVQGVAGLPDWEDAEEVRVSASASTARILRVPADPRLSYDWRLRCVLASEDLTIPARLRG